MKISVIIPVYNVGEYLPRCLDSVISQTYADLEIICVNDCSSDKSSIVLNEYAKKDLRIKVINREKNGGLSAARNSGINAAKGDYLYFIDSDDWIDKDYIEKMIGTALKSNSDIVVNTNVIRDFEDKASEPLFFGNLSPLKEEFVQAKDAINNVMWSAWSQLFKTEFIKKHNLTFPEGYIYEDMYFSPNAYMHTDRIYKFYGPAYHYCIRNSGITGSLSNKQNESLFNLFKVFNSVLDLYLKIGNNASIRLFPEDFIVLPDNNYDKKLYEYMRKYFERAKIFIRRDKNLYHPVEYQLFEDVLCSFDKFKNTNYYKLKVFSNLRKNIIKPKSYEMKGPKNKCIKNQI